MGRIRTIKPEFPQSESIGRLSRDARLLFILLWTVADDEGRARAAHRMLANLLLPFDEDSPNLITGWLSELEREGHIKFYEAENSLYLYIPNWLKHQKIERPSKSRLPPPPGYNHKVVTEASPNSHRSLTEASVTDLGPRTKEGTKEEASLLSELASSVGTKSEQGLLATARVDGALARPAPPAVASEESKRPSEEERAAQIARLGIRLKRFPDDRHPIAPTPAADLKPEPPPIKAVSNELRAIEQAKRNGAQNGKGLRQDAGQLAALVAPGLPARGSPQQLDGGQAGQPGIPSVGGVLRANGVDAAVFPERAPSAGDAAVPVAERPAIVTNVTSVNGNGNFYASLGSPEQRAWEDYLGVVRRYDDGGMDYPAQWPPT